MFGKYSKRAKRKAEQLKAEQLRAEQIKEEQIRRKVDYACLEEPHKSMTYEELHEEFAHHAHDKIFDWGWHETRYNRTAAVNALVAKYDACSYLEIGCFNNALFDAVPCKDKTGVDPSQGGTHRMTSDDFFAQNKKKFDVIFIDGLHHYAQVRKDAINAIACLKPGGWIAFHDFLPSNWMEQHVPALHDAWTGDCWKLGYELSQSPDIDFHILQIDHGVGVMRLKRENAEITDLGDKLRDVQFDVFVDIQPELPIVSWQDGVKWIHKNG